MGLHRGGVSDVNVLGQMLTLISANPQHLAFAGFMGYDPFVGMGVPGILGSPEELFAKVMLIYQRNVDFTRQQFPALKITDAEARMLGHALIGAVSLRTRGVYFIMITLAFAQMVYYFAISWPAYGGEDGLSIVVRNQFAGLNTMKPLSFFLLQSSAMVEINFQDSCNWLMDYAYSKGRYWRMAIKLFLLESKAYHY